MLGLDVGVDFPGVHQIERVDYKEWGSKPSAPTPLRFLLKERFKQVKEREKKKEPRLQLTSPLYSLHQINSTIPQLQRQIINLTQPNTMFARTCSTEADSALDHFVDCDLHSVEFSIVSEKGKGMDVAVAYVTVAGRRGGDYISLASKEENEEDREDRRKERRGKRGRRTYPKWHATRPRFSKSSEVSCTSVGNLEIGTLDDTIRISVKTHAKVIT